MPLAHTEGSLTLSMTRGAAAAGDDPHARPRRPDHPRLVLRLRRRGATAAGARPLDRGRAAGDAGVARGVGRPDALAPRAAARGEDARRRADVPRALGLDDRRRGRAEHDDPQRLRAEHGVRDAAGAGEAGARDPRGEHGRRQEAVVRVLPVGAREDGDRRGVHPRRPIRRVLHTTAADLEALSWAGTHGAVASGMQSVAFTPATAIAAVFAATGQDLGMVGTSSMAHGTARRVEGGLQASIRFPGLEVGTVGGGTTLPSARDWLASIGCAGPGKRLPLRPDRRGGGALPRDQRLGLDGDRRQRELLPGPPRARRPAMMLIALVFSYDVRTRRVRAGLRPRGRVGAVLPRRPRLHRHRAPARRRDPGRYSSSTAGSRARPTTTFVAANRDEYMRRVDETALRHDRGAPDRHVRERLVSRARGRQRFLTSRAAACTVGR